jgi:hypothetical protein
MGRACSTNGREEECIEDIGGKAREKETTRKTKTYSPFAETRESSLSNARDISFALRMKSCNDHVMCVPFQGCPKSECRLTCFRMQ